MASGRIMRTEESGERPEMKTVKRINIVAMEFLEAKKPLAVLMSPAMAIDNEASPTIGDNIVDW